MRLLVINWQDPSNPRAGGAEVHLREILRRLVARGHQVTLLASGWPGCEPRETTDGVEIHRVGGRYSFALRAPLYFRRVLASRAFDVVIEDLNKVPLYVPTWTALPVVLIAHHLFGSSAFGAASFPVASVTWVLEQTLGLAYRGVPVQTVSESTAEDLCRHGLRDEDITVIHNGVSLDRQTAPPGARASNPTFLYLGRLQAYKRVDLILRAVAKRNGGDDERRSDGREHDEREAFAADDRKLSECNFDQPEDEESPKRQLGMRGFRDGGVEARTVRPRLGECLDVDKGGVGHNGARGGRRGNANRGQHCTGAAGCRPRRLYWLARS